MKNLSSIYFLLLFMIFSQINFAQDYKDCATAYSPCGESPFYFEILMGIGTSEPEIDTTCVLGEMNSTWITWTVIQGGILTFVLTPDSVWQDLDFLVYKFNTDNNCKNKELVRCMASGENISMPPDQWEICMGPTGLAVGEIDTEEFAGCSSTDNNFLAPIETNQGDSYVMLVNDFTNIGMGFTLSFGGNAKLDCITVPIIELEENSFSSFKLYPSVSSGILFIELTNEKLLDAQLSIFNMRGQLVYSEDSVKQLSHQINLADMPNGIYVANLQKGKIVSTKRFIIVR